MVGKSEVNTRASRLLEVFNYMLTLLAMASSNYGNVSGFIWVAYCRPTINSTKMILSENEKKECAHKLKILCLLVFFFTPLELT